MSAPPVVESVWIALASVPLVTAPAAPVSRHSAKTANPILRRFAAGSRHLRRHLGHHPAGPREFVADLRRAARHGWLVGLAGIAACAAVLTDLRVAAAGPPGGRLAAAVGIFALLGAAVTVLRAAAGWEPGAHWRPLLGAAARRTVRAPAGSLLLVCGLAVVTLCAGFLAPLAVPALGVLAAAAVAVEERDR